MRPRRGCRTLHHDERLTYAIGRETLKIWECETREIASLKRRSTDLFMPSSVKLNSIRDGDVLERGGLDAPTTVGQGEHLWRGTGYHMG